MSVLLIAAENIPMTFHVKLSPFICQSFPDYRTASNYRSRTTKTTCMLNGAFVAHLLTSLTDAVKV